ncbi:odorant receptor 49b-like [Periplaneta americana]|uniref:odorant receptor 49b-like n=1 Tax=Periplaneta americana TaxID=6978 RepID=UPI0030916140|nr:odorant receptor 62 [Periplaneta americana]
MRAGSMFYATPYLYAKLVSLACVQLEKLRGSLLSIKQNVLSPDTQAEINIPQSEVKEQLNDIIRHHIQILNYINVLQEFSGLLTCGILFLFLLTLCFCAFSVIMSWDDPVDLYQGAWLYFAVVVMAFFYCSMGTVLAQEFEAVGEAAYASDWVGAPVPYQKSISFMMLISNKGKTLVGGGIVPVTNETLMSMINESMSLFMFLLTMKDKSEKSNA